MRAIRGKSQIGTGVVTVAQRKKLLWVIDRFEMMSNYILGRTPYYVFNLKWNKKYLFRVSDEGAEYNQREVDVCYSAVSGETDNEELLSGVIHEVYHIKLWPYVRLAEDCAPKCLSREFVRREEEMICAISDDMVRTLKLTEDWEKMLGKQVFKR